MTFRSAAKRILRAAVLAVAIPLAVLVWLVAVPVIETVAAAVRAVRSRFSGIERSGRAVSYFPDALGEPDSEAVPAQTSAPQPGPEATPGDRSGSAAA